ncbi:MAG TPA: hypothetical protein VIM08_18070 [Arthrobacter sp.]
MKAGKNVRFAALVKRLNAEGIVHNVNVELIDTGRQIRNDAFAHPKNVIAFPLVMAVNTIRTSHRLVARLFPDAIASSRTTQSSQRRYLAGAPTVIAGYSPWHANSAGLAAGNA